LDARRTVWVVATVNPSPAIRRLPNLSSQDNIPTGIKQGLSEQDYDWITVPKIVDHDLRRREVARAAVRIIARDGLEAATTRAVAAESGWSTGVLKHYFAGKDDLLHHALTELETTNAELLEAASSEPTGYQELRRALLTILGSDADHSKVWIAFMSRAAVDRATAAEMERGAAAWQRRWQRILVRGQHDGSIRNDVASELAATELWALVFGLRMAALFNPGVGRRWRHGGLELLKGLRGTATSSQVSSTATRSPGSCQDEGPAERMGKK
jgi:AcrR family transcriptional regulator